jgi:hypothetical protein
MKKLDRVLLILNEQFREKLKTKMAEKFGIEVFSFFDIFGSMNLVTRRVDEQDFTKEQADFMAAFEAGFLAAWDLVQAEANKS